MEVTRILAEIDAQIGKLQHARAILAGVDTSVATKRSVGRPKKGTPSPVVPAKQTGAGKKKRNLSPEARKRIADAQKRRWAEQRKEA